VNVTDGKSGLDVNSVVYRFKELGCPDSGVGVNGSCYNSGWINMTNFVGSVYSATVSLSGIDENSSGVYWLEVEAKDVLGNLGVLTE